MTPVDISILMVTYNHEGYIANAIDSVLQQVGPFVIELVIGNDCSTDKTFSVISDYQARYPQTIKCVTSNITRGYQGNLMDTLGRCAGRYVAILDGDDYWTDCNKLKKQLAILESSPCHVICFARTLERVEQDGVVVASRTMPILNKIEFTIEDLLEWDFIPTSTAVFRNTNALKNLPSWMIELPTIDWALWTLLAQHGTIVYLPDTVSVYRKHSQGLWTGKTIRDQLRCNQMFYERIRSELPERYGELITLGLRRLHHQYEQAAQRGILDVSGFLMLEWAHTRLDA